MDMTLMDMWCENYEQIFDTITLLWWFFCSLENWTVG